MRTRALLPFIAVCLVACTDPSESIDSLKAEVELLKIDVAAQEMRLGTLESANAAVTPAYVILGRGYGIAKTHLGMSFLVSWKDSKIQGDGTLVMLEIGNPYAADFAGVTITAEYAGEPKSPDSNQSASANNGKIETQITDTLIGGRWNRVTFRIPRVKPDEISTMRIALVSDMVSLIK